MKKTQLQLIGITALFIAAKMEVCGCVGAGKKNCGKECIFAVSQSVDRKVMI